MSTPDPNDLLSCPYNLSHQIERYKMQFHLEKCRKQHSNSKRSTCPFDATHIVYAGELDYHVSVCPKRVMFDTQRYVMDDGAHYSSTASEVPNVVAEENWDDDNYTSYQPDLPRHVITRIRGATPSERRKARMEGVRNYNPPPPEPQS